MYSYIQCTAAAAADALRVDMLLLLLQRLMLFAIVSQMAEIVAGLLDLIPSSVFFVFTHGWLLTYPLEVLSHSQPRFGYYTTSSVNRVPDGRNYCWFIGSGSIQCFLSLHKWLAFNVPLGRTVAFTASIWRFCHIFGICGYALSQDGRQPSRRRPPL